MRLEQKEFAEFIGQVCKGQEHAANFLIMLTDVAHFFDDVYDGDVNIDKSVLLNAMWKAMVAIPRNEFYRKFFWELQPLVANAINN